MRLTVNIDHGFAMNLDLIACFLRLDEDPNKTRVVMASGNTFIFHAPLSDVVRFIENGGQAAPPDGKGEVVGGTGEQATKQQDSDGSESGGGI